MAVGLLACAGSAEEEGDDVTSSSQTASQCLIEQWHATRTDYVLIGSPSCWPGRPSSAPPRDGNIARCSNRRDTYEYDCQQATDGTFSLMSRKSGHTVYDTAFRPACSSYAKGLWSRESNTDYPTLSACAAAKRIRATTQTTYY